jgi:hypothetical protein
MTSRQEQWDPADLPFPLFAVFTVGVILLDTVLIPAIVAAILCAPAVGICLLLGG